MPSTRKKRHNSRGRRRGAAATKTPRHGGRGGLQRVRALKLERRSDLPSPIPPPSPTSTNTSTMALEQRSMLTQEGAGMYLSSGVNTLYMTPEQVEAVPRVNNTPTLLRKQSLLKSSGATTDVKRRKPGLWISALQGIAMVRDGILDAVIPLRREYRRVQTELVDKEELLAEVTAHNERLQGLLVDALSNQREDVPTASASVQTDERLLRTALAKPRRTRSCASQTAAVRVSTHGTQTTHPRAVGEGKPSSSQAEKRSVAVPQRRHRRYNVLPAPVFHPTKTVATQTRSATCDARSYKEAALYRADAPLPTNTRLTDPLFGPRPSARGVHTEISTQTTPPPPPQVQATATAASHTAVQPPAPPQPPACLAPPPPPPPPPPPLPSSLTASATPLRLTKQKQITPKTGSPLKRGGPLRPLNFTQEQLRSARLKPVRDAENTPPPMSLASIEASTVQQARTRLRKTNAARSPGGTPRKQMVSGGGTGILPTLYAALVERFRNARSPPSHESSAAPSPA